MFGAAPNLFAHPQNILLSVLSCVWTSRPITGSQSSRCAHAAASFAAGGTRTGVQSASSITWPGAEEQRLREVRADELRADREVLALGRHDAARDDEPRDAGEVEGAREDVAQVHLERVVHLLAELERRGRGGRAEQDVARLERLVEVLLEQRPHARARGRSRRRGNPTRGRTSRAGCGAAPRGRILRGATRRRADRCRRRRRRGGRSGRRRSARGSTRPRPSRRCSRSESRTGVWGRRTFTSVAPAASSARAAAITASRTRRVDGVAEVLVGEADLESADALRGGRATTGAGAASAHVASSGSGPAIDFEEARRVLDGASERSDLVERRAERDEAVAADAAVGRLEADGAGERRRLPHRAAGVAAEPDERRVRPRPRRPSRRSIRPACGSRPTGCARGRTPSSRWTSPSRTRPCSSCRRSPRRRRGTAASRSRRRAGGSSRGCGCRTSPAIRSRRCCP